MLARCFFPVLLVLGYLTAPIDGAQAANSPQARAPQIEPAPVRTDTPSGYPVPRFVSLKQVKTPCRRGPSFDQPVRYTFLRAGMPVLVVAETTDHWRKIRDIAGDECWAHKLTLTAQTHVIAAEALDLLARPTIGAPVRARLGGGAFARIETRKNQWVRLSVNRDGKATGPSPRKPRKARGWAQAASLWGTDAALAFANPD